MAVVTFTKRQVVDMIPEFLTRRLATFGPKSKARAAELGISENALGQVNNVLVLRDGDVVKRSTYVFRSPYAVKRPLLEKGWTEIVAAGLASATADGWRVSPRALEIASDMSRRIRDHVRGLPFPAEPTKRAAKALWALAERVPASAVRTAQAKRVAPGPDEPASDAITLTRASQILWGFRDDCHIAAWQAAGYDGPTFEVLSFVWAGPGDISHTKLPAVGSIDALEKALAPRQDRADVERNVDALAKKGDLARDGDSIRITPQGQKTRDAIEADTDRRYFAIWDLDDAATARLGDDLRAVIDALPKA
ncbi:MAG: hypothetical protein HYX56_03300 [Chloroflexi bacterium]|nr:hypothetical protein [Chloroflexota bacterium]